MVIYTEPGTRPNAAWWTPRRFTTLVLASLAAGVFFVLVGVFHWRGSASGIIGVLGAVTVVVALFMLALLVKKQSWGWLFRKDNSTTKWQT